MLTFDICARFRHPPGCFLPSQCLSTGWRSLWLLAFFKMSVKGAQHEDSATLVASDAGALCHSWRHCDGVGAAIYE